MALVSSSVGSHGGGVMTEPGEPIRRVMSVGVVAVDEKLTLRSVADGRYAAEQPEGDVADVESLAPRDDAMAELVGEQRREERDRRDERGEPVLERAIARREAGQTGGREAPGEQPEDDEHAPVELDPDPVNRTDANALEAVHVRPGSSPGPLYKRLRTAPSRGIRDTRQV